MKRPYFCLYGCYVPPASLVKELTSMDDVEMIVPGAAEACCIVRLITWRLRCSVIANTQNPKFEYGDNLFQAMHCIVTWSSQSVKAIASHSTSFMYFLSKLSAGRGLCGCHGDQQ